MAYITDSFFCRFFVYFGCKIRKKNKTRTK